MNLICPKCSALMEIVSIDGTAVDRCVNCGGLWFDLMEQRHLREVRGAARVLDVGDASIGRNFDLETFANCPRCNVPLTHLRDVGYEYCVMCNGTFFDAGEFTRYAGHGFASWFRSRVARRSA